MAFSGNECHSEQENIFISAPEQWNSGKIHFEIGGGGKMATRGMAPNSK